jgi:hypothetical protein
MIAYQCIEVMKKELERVLPPHLAGRLGRKTTFPDFRGLEAAKLCCPN